MRWFVRGPAPRELIEFRKTPAAEGAGPPRWDELPSAVLDAVRKRLFQAQRGLCCYCGRRLDLETAGRTHVEHVIPRSDPSVDPFEWNNLALSCDGGNADGSAPHCDHAKGSEKLDYVEPFERPTFEVTKLKFSGLLKVARTAADRDVTEVLMLNAKSLVDRRESALRALVDSMPEKAWTTATCARVAEDLERSCVATTRAVKRDEPTVARAPDFAPWLIAWLRAHGS